MVVFFHPSVETIKGRSYGNEVEEHILEINPASLIMPVPELKNDGKGRLLIILGVGNLLNSGKLLLNFRSF